MLKRYWRAEAGIFLAVWLVLMVGGRSRLFRDPGTFWHTVVGERMLSSREFADTDSFSYTFAGAPWVPFQWLGECAMAAAHRLDGLDSLLLATATLLAGFYTWVASRLLRAGLHWSLTAVLVMLAVGASTSHFHVRPHLFTVVFLGVVFANLGDFEAGRIGRGRLFWLVPLFAVWTNVHGGVLGGLLTLALATAYWAFSWAVGRESPVKSLREATTLVMLVAACGLTAFLNPYGVGLPAAWLDIMESPILPRIIVEHAPLKPTQPEGILVLCFGGLYAAALLSGRPRWPRATWLLPLVWMYLAWSRVRHAPLFSTLTVLALAEVLPCTRWVGWLSEPGRDLFQPRQPGPRAPVWRPALLPAVVVLAAAVLQGAAVRVPVVGHGWARLDPSYWPVELVPELRRQEQTSPGGARIFNEYQYGGFLIYHAPGLRVFVDDRCELYGDQWLLEFVEAEWGNTGEYLEAAQRRHGRFRLALTITGSGFDRHFRQARGWEVVRQTETATLYRLRPPGDKP